MFFMIVVFGVAAIALFSFIVMSLWNSILPGVIHVGTITFWQAAGILLLGKILFGGFPGGRGGWGRHPRWRGKMMEKWQNMTPEEREKFKQQWRERCGHWGRTPFPEEGQTTSQENPNK
jgi:Ca2+/H+ antiporter, TMEM165/GDT1 family